MFNKDLFAIMFFLLMYGILKYVSHGPRGPVRLKMFQNVSKFEFRNICVRYQRSWNDMFLSNLSTIIHYFSIKSDI